MNAEQVMTAEYSFSDEDLPVSDIDGLSDTVQSVREDKIKRFHRCEDRLCNYDVYWNEKTDSVRIAAVVPAATYEVTDGTSLSEFE